MSTATMLVRLVVAMAVVIAVMWLAARALRARGGGPVSVRAGRPAAPIDVLARRGLSKGASVAVVRAGGRTMVLGVTDASVTLLGEVDPTDEAADSAGLTAADPGGPHPPTAAGGLRPLLAQKSLVDALRELTVRRG